MDMRDQEVRITPSVLDRLLDDHPQFSEEPPEDRTQNIQELKNSVARDLEALLNSRQEALAELPEEWAELRSSLLTYGLPDFTGLSLRSANDHARIRRSLEQAVANFEPRLERVRVTIEAPEGALRLLHFRVEAMLHVEPAAEPVRFDAVLQLATQLYKVSQER
jgi:type VI secretion system protein ImpF